jgi:hypothetical protein
VIFESTVALTGAWTCRVQVRPSARVFTVWWPGVTPLNENWPVERVASGAVGLLHDISMIVQELDRVDRSEWQCLGCASSHVCTVALTTAHPESAQSGLLALPVHPAIPTRPPRLLPEPWASSRDALSEERCPPRRQTSTASPKSAAESGWAQ